MINAARLGFWTAILTVVDTGAFFVLGIATPARSGPFAPPSSIIPYPYTSVAQFVPGDYVWLYPGFLLAPLFVVLMACVHDYARDERKVFSQVGLSFAVLYAAVIMINYFLQFTVVIPSLQSGETAGLGLLTQYNPHGVFIVLEALGYLMMSASLVFAAVVFSGGRLRRMIRWLFVASFVVALVSFVGLQMLGYDIVAFEVTILLVNWIVLMVSGTMLSVLFRRGRPPE